MKCKLTVVVLASLLLQAACSPAEVRAEEPKPAAAGDEGRRAFDDLAKYYADREKVPPFAKAIEDLQAADPATRRKAGEYLLALFKQTFADEDNGRSPWRQTPFFGGGSVNDARELRKQLGKAFGEKAAGEAALGATLWLLNEERLPDNQKAGLLVLARIEGPAANAALKTLIKPLHPNVDVATRTIAEVGRRGLKDLGPELLPLCAHYRTAVREAAVKVAKDLNLAPVPEYMPEKAFTPVLTGHIEDVAAMILAEIPKDARWVEATVEGENGGTVTGWLLGEKGDYRLVNWFGEEVTLPKKETKIKQIALADTAKLFGEIRSGGDREAVGRLSRRGMLTAQFQPRFLSQPELVVGAWAFTRGERKVAAEVLFGRIDDMRDDRWLTDIARDLLGHTYHQEMLEAFGLGRDYARALVLARHLSKPVFKGYQYHERAQKLAAQLPKRAEDFKTFVLPTAEEWKAQQAKLSREEQIKYLAGRLRLLNCRQWGQPGGVNYEDEQNSASFSQAKANGKKVINPYNELDNLKLQVADLPVLVPFLADDSYMLVYSYWRDFHPGRTLHQVNWAVANLVNEAATRDLADLGTYNGLDEAGRKKHLEKILAWCKANAGKSRTELLLDTAATAEDWREVQAASARLVAEKELKVLPVLVARSKDFPKMQGSIAEMCSKLDSADAVKPAREWVKSKEEATKFWAALILLRHGDRANTEGLEPLKEVLARDDGSHFYPRALDALLAVKCEPATTLAVGILQKPRFADDFNHSAILHRLILAGRKEALDHVLAGLDDTESAGTSLGKYQGKEVKREQTRGDRMAGAVAEWRTDKWEFENLAPDDQRKKQREELKGWLKEQFARIKAGQKPEMRTEVRPLRFPEWQLDAP
jgi:hypothetical protein